MLRVGITGGIGSGKSFVCKKIEALGFPVYYCDDEAKRLMVEDGDIVKGLIGLIGPDSYIENKEQNSLQLNKPVVANFLFASSENVQKINSLVHPRVKADFQNWASRQNSKAVFMESAILFEAHFKDVVDRTMLKWNVPCFVTIQAVSKLKAGCVSNKTKTTSSRWLITSY